MIYISGAITGTTDYLERFAAAENKLRALGYIPINPAKVNAQLPPETTYPQYMKMSLAMLEMCDTIYMLDGWTKSRGAWLEFDYAKRMEKTVLYEYGGELDGSNKNKAR